MITTLFLLQLIGFQLWYITSKQVKHTSQPAYLVVILSHPQSFRYLGSALLVLATGLFIVKWGPMTGICASIVGLMGVGCLIVLLSPLHYISGKIVVAIYALCTALELFI